MTLNPEPLPRSLDALENVVYYFDRYTSAQTLKDQAGHLIELSNAVSGLRSFHPGYDPDSNTMPWDREDDDDGSNEF